MPEQPPISGSIEHAVAEFLDANPATSDQLLPLLHFVQQTHGHIPIDTLGTISQALNLSRAEVFGVVSFYDDFRTEPHGVTVEICGAEACQALGCRSLHADLRANLDQNVNVKEVFCLGNCAVGPSVRIGNKVLGRATLPRIQAVLGETGIGA
jgi:formate dehydrogenase subunit gamma